MRNGSYDMKYCLFIMMLLLLLNCSKIPLEPMGYDIPKPTHDQGVLDGFLEGRHVTTTKELTRIINQYINGECYEYAYIGVWGLARLDIPARIVYLGNTRTGECHALCVSDNNRLLVNELGAMTIPQENWKAYLLLKNPKYNEALE